MDTSDEVVKIARKAKWNFEMKVSPNSHNFSVFHWVENWKLDFQAEFSEARRRKIDAT